MVKSWNYQEKILLHDAGISLGNPVRKNEIRLCIAEINLRNSQKDQNLNASDFSVESNHIRMKSKLGHNLIFDDVLFWID